MFFFIQVIFSQSNAPRGNWQLGGAGAGKGEAGKGKAGKQLIAFKSL
jgi:hypothetical protein